MSRYIVMTSSAKMPSGVKGPYKRVALVEVADSCGRPKMISERAEGVIRIVEVRERCHLGFRPKGNTAAEVAIRELQAEADRLNAGISTAYDPENRDCFENAIVAVIIAAKQAMLASLYTRNMQRIWGKS